MSPPPRIGFARALGVEQAGRRCPSGWSGQVAAVAVKLTQWRALLRKAGGEPDLDLAQVVTRLREWLWPVLEKAGGRRGAP
jgi:hypothetical protein